MTMSVTKTVEIGRPAAESYNFIADPGLMDDELAALKACREREAR